MSCVDDCMTGADELYRQIVAVANVALEQCQTTECRKGVIAQMEIDLAGCDQWRIDCVIGCFRNQYNLPLEPES